MKQFEVPQDAIRQYLRDRIAARGLSQSEVSRQTQQLGEPISQPYLNQVLTGGRPFDALSTSKREALRQVLGASREEWLERTGYAAGELSDPVSRDELRDMLTQVQALLGERTAPPRVVVEVRGEDADAPAREIVFDYTARQPRYLGFECRRRTVHRIHPGDVVAYLAEPPARVGQVVIFRVDGERHAGYALETGADARRVKILEPLSIGGGVVLDADEIEGVFQFVSVPDPAAYDAPRGFI